MFLNSLMLVGIAAAVVPLVLHLLSRARYKDVVWGGMMFLEGADSQRRQSSRFTQILLLLLRSLIIATLALALARPVVQGKWVGQESSGRVTAALILDCSASMSFDENGRTRFQMAKAAARQIIRNLRPGDRVSLILMGVPRSPVDLEPTGDLRAVEARIDEAKVGFGRANIHDSLDLAGDLLARYEKSARDLYLVTDHQALSWDGVDAHFAAEWKRRMHGPGINTRMFVLPVGSADSDNLAVESIRLINPPAIAGQPTDIEVVVRNYGSVQHAAIPLSLDAPTISLPPRSISLGAGQSTSVVFNLTFPQSGSQVLTAQLKSSGYTGDDQLRLAVNVIAPIRVLVISGDASSAQVHGAGDFLKWALAPHRSSGATGADPCSVTVLPAEKWTDIDLTKYQVVVLANVERFSTQQEQSLDKYVYNGGGLFVAPGSLSRIENYNERLYHDGAGVLPALLLPATAADGSESTSLLGMQTDHPVFQFLRGRFEMPTASIARYFPTVPRQVKTTVLARYLSNDPFLIEGSSERGHVLLMTTALDADWSTLPLSNFYLPFVQSAVRFLAGGAVANANLLPGDPIRLKFDESAATGNVMLTRPDGKKVKLDVVRREKHAEIRYADTDLPGVYRVVVQDKGRPDELHQFIVLPPREESDLTQLSEDRWQSLAQTMNFTRVDATKPIAEALASNREGRELWGLLLTATFVLAAMELWLAKVGSVEKKAPLRIDQMDEPATETDERKTWRADVPVRL
jgi:hypothetical protein